MGQTSSREFQPQKQTVFKSGKGCIYRIPALFHMRGSTTLLAFTELRKTKKDESATHLYMKTGTLMAERSDVETIEWSEIKMVKEAHLCGYRSMNPCPVYEKTTNTLFLFFTCVEDSFSEWWQINNGCNKTRLCYVTSKDLGQSWSVVTDLTDKLSEIKEWATFAVGSGHGIQTESGRLIVPVYAYVLARLHHAYALSLYSEDFGKKWQFGKMLQNESLECQMAEFFDDKGSSLMYCNARTNGKGREEAVSTSEGSDFCDLRKGKLVETGNGCQGSVVSFPAQSEAANMMADPSQNPKWLLFTHSTDIYKRINLGAYLNKSPNDTNAWSKPWIINSGPSGYSDLVYIGNGWFACLMECGKKCETEQIASVVFNYEKIKEAIGE